MEYAARRFSDLNLSMLPFPIATVARGRIDIAADAFDAVRPDGRGWQSWSLPESSSPGVPMAFLTSVVCEPSSSDWVEIDLGAEYQFSTALRITCEIQTACWCSTDHNMHIVEQHSWLAGNEEILATTFEKAVALGVGWLGTDLDPDHLRHQAGLPARQ
jgi:hypothetical protein